MDPVTVHRSPTGISKPMLIGLVLALAIGAYLGGSLASGLNQGGLGSVVALVVGLILGTILAVMAVVAAILAKSRDTSGQRGCAIDLLRRRSPCHRRRNRLGRRAGVPA